jgi:hypothetical protein
VTASPNKPPPAADANGGEAAPKEAGASESGRNPVPPGSKTGLLGLFKKQS